MAHTTKIATCCYCGSRAALVLDKGRHELACASCGAPLHDMKKFRKQTTAKKSQKSYSREYAQSEKRENYPPSHRKVRKKRKGLMRHIFEEAFDVIEDIFD